MSQLSLAMPPFDMHGEQSSLGIRWEKWIARFENYAVALGVVEEERKTALLLFTAGDDVTELYETLPEQQNGAAQTDPYLKAKRRLLQYFTPKVNPDFELFNFRQAQQKQGESIDQFYARLLKLAKTCNFHETKEEIKSQIILNTSNPKIRRYGLTEKPSLDALLDKARSLEISEKQAAQIEGPSQELSSSNLVNRLRSNYSQHKTNSNNKCRNCGNNWHANGRSSCPASSVKCHKCQKQGHFAKVCLQNAVHNNNNDNQSNNNHNSNSKNDRISSNNQNFDQRSQRNNRNNNNNVNSVQRGSSDDSDSTYTIVTNSNNCEREKTPTVKIDINGLEISFIIDTGATINTISEEVFHKINEKGDIALAPDETVAHSYTKQQLEIIGKFTTKINVSNNSDKSVTTEIRVVKGYYDSLLSYQTSKKIGLDSS